MIAVNPVKTVENNTFPLFITTVVIDVPVNTSVPIDVIASVIVIPVIPEQFLKALLPIVVTVAGIVIEVNAVQPLNVSFDIFINC